MCLPGLSWAYEYQIRSRSLPRAQGIALTREAAERALAADDNMALAWSTLSYLKKNMIGTGKAPKPPWTKPYNSSPIIQTFFWAQLPWHPPWDNWISLSNCLSAPSRWIRFGQYSAS
jgi:hypothetical protein